jgi:flagellar basal-body rod protein FlgF
MGRRPRFAAAGRLTPRGSLGPPCGGLSLKKGALKKRARWSKTRDEMDLGLYIAATGMVAEQTRQDQISNDLANASTPGYKPDRSTQSSFGELLLSSSTTGRPIGAVDEGVALGKSVTDMTPAGMQDTGQPLDFGIVGAGLFAVQTPQGVRYTRDGQFSASATGQLVNAAGDPVLDAQGHPLAVGAGGRVPASSLGIYEVPGAVKQGENLFSGNPAGKASGTVRQGALELSGVDAAKAMVDMIGSMRTFQSGQQAIQAIDQTLQEASSQVGTLNGTP